MAKEKKPRKFKVVLIISLLSLIFGISTMCRKFLNDYFLNMKDNKEITEFFEMKDEQIQDDTTKTNNDTVTKVTTPYEYTAVLEIPSINLKRGLFDINNRNNNVNITVQIMKDSDMPDVDKGLLVLAGHSGNSRIGFFNKLNKVKYKDLIYIYYNNFKYIYEVLSIDKQDKTGKISFPTFDTTLVLTTCDPKNKGKQIVVVANLIEKLSY